MPRIPKTIEVQVIQSRYLGGGGHGWEDVMEYEPGDSLAQMKKDLQEYRFSDRTSLHRLIRRRVPNPAYVAPVAVLA